MTQVLAFTEFDDADLRDDTWVDLFPWLDTYESRDAAHLEGMVPGVADWWISDSPQITRADVELGDLVLALGALIVRRHRDVVLGELAPQLDKTTPLAALRLRPRPETVVRRLAGRDCVAALLTTDARTLFAIRGTSAETVQEIAAGVVGAALLVEPGQGMPPDEATDNPAAAQLVDDLAVLSRWRRLRGQLDEPLIVVAIDDDAPEDVQEAASRVGALSAADFDRPTEANPVDEIENLVEQLDERGRIVLRSHLMAESPISMGELSSRLHVSKSRAGGIVAAVKHRLAEACGYQTAAGGLLGSIRAEIAPVAPLDRLLRRHPVLSETVPSLGVPLWLALDRLDDFFEVTGRWAAAPDVRAAKSRTITMVEQFESPNGVVDLADAAGALNLTADETREWLSFSDIPVFEDRLLLSTRTMADHAAGVLEVAARPLAVRELMDILDTDRSVATVERRLDADERIDRVGEEWCLAESPATAESRQTVGLRRTRRLYRIGDTWAFRSSVTADQLRGAGLTIPAGVALAFGARPGTVREIPSPLGPQMIRWTGTHPTCGTIRRFLVDLAAEPKDIVFLTFSDKHGFDVRPIVHSETDDELRQALALVGHPSPDDLAADAIPAALAVAAGLPADAKPRRILSTFQSRDDEVAELLHAQWVVARR